MKRRRALLLSLTIVLALCAACDLWLHRERRQYALNRQLINALERNDTETALALVNAGADPNTRLYASAPPTLPQLLKQLVHRTPTLAYDYNPTAFLMVCGRTWERVINNHSLWINSDENPSLIRDMLAHGANARLGTSDGYTPLHYAAMFGRARTMELLLQHGADVNESAQEGVTPLMLAVQTSTPDATDVLLTRGANLHAQDSDGYTLLHFAASSGHARTAELLLQHGADVNASTKDGETPLTLAAENNTRSMAHVLLSQGANPNAQDANGKTALHHAVYGTHAKDLIPELLAHRADPNVKNKKGQTPLMVAQDWNYPGIVRLLKQHGAK